jgi:hypothetical protein
MEDTYIDEKISAYSTKLLSNEDLIDLRHCNELLQQSKKMLKKFVFSTSSTTLGTKMSCINFKESDELRNIIEEEG